MKDLPKKTPRKIHNRRFAGHLWSRRWRISNIFKPFMWKWVICVEGYVWTQFEPEWISWWSEKTSLNWWRLALENWTMMISERWRQASIDDWIGNPANFRPSYFLQDSTAAVDTLDPTSKPTRQVCSASPSRLDVATTERASRPSRRFHAWHHANANVLSFDEMTSTHVTLIFGFAGWLERIRGCKNCWFANELRFNHRFES